MAVTSHSLARKGRMPVLAAGPLEQALGLLATLMLRNPAAAELAAESGCIDSCVEAMQACQRDAFTDSGTGTQWVLRQVRPGRM